VLEARAARIYAADETYFRGDGVPAEKALVDSGREGRWVTFEMRLVPDATLTVSRDMRMQVYACIYIYVYAFIFMYMYVVSMYVCIYACMHACMHVHIYLHTHTHTHTHTHK